MSASGTKQPTKLNAHHRHSGSNPSEYNFLGGDNLRPVLCLHPIINLLLTIFT